MVTIEDVLKAEQARHEYIDYNMAIQKIVQIAKKHPECIDLVLINILHHFLNQENSEIQESEETL